MLDTYFKQFFWTFHLAVLFAGAFLVARTVNVFIGSALETPAESIAGDQVRAGFGPGPKSAGEEIVPITAFLDRNLFKAAREDLKAEAEAAAMQQEEEGVFNENSCEASTINADLLATIVSSNHESSLAMFLDKGKQEAEAYRIGDKLLDQGELVSIEWRRVLVKHSGRCESFSLQEAPGAVPSDAVAGMPPPPIEGAPGDPKFGEGVKQTGGDEYEIPRAEIDNVLSNLNQIATQARIVPSFHNGKANGFKLFSIRPGSLYSKIGIQNGDIIQKINGFEMNSPEKALEIYSKLKDAQGITVDLVRRGKSKTLSYNIR